MTYEMRAQKKLDMLDILQSRPNITTMELSKILNINRTTAKTYREDIEQRINKTVQMVEKRINESVEVKVSIWQKLEQKIMELLK